MRARAALLVMAAVLLWQNCAATAADDQQLRVDARYELDIDAPRLDLALNALAQQANVQLLFPFDVVSRMKAQPVVGRYTAAEALALLLADSALESRITRSGVIAISPKEAATSISGGTTMSGSFQSSQSTPSAAQPRKRTLLAKIGAALGALLLAPPSNAQQAGTPAQALLLEEIVVSAQRRGDQKVLDIPMAVSAFGGDWAEDRGYTGLDDFIQMAPGVSMLEFLPGLNRIQMRGVSAGVGENNVGFYLDEVPMAFINQANLPDLRAFDLERVEILRGPQSTLYGAGALAGVVRSISKDPLLDAYELKADMSASTTKDGGDNHAVNLAFNAPLVNERLGARVVYTREDEEGWVDQSVLGKRNYNDSQVESLRLKVLGSLTENLSASLMYWGSRIDSRGMPETFDDRTGDDGSETPSRFDYDIYNLSVRYAAAAFDVVSSTSYSTLDTHMKTDYFFGFALDSLLDPKTFTQEVRLVSSDTGRWQWTAGGYYRDSEQLQIQGSPASALLGIDPVIQYDEVDAWNVFGELTGKFFDGRFETTVGGRYLNETRSSEQRVRPSTPYENDFDDVILRFNATWRPSDHWMTYFNYGEGFRSGINQFALSLETAAALGVLLPSSAQPEHADSYELGVKGSFFDSRLTLDVALFYIDWQDMQTVVPVVAGALYGIVNAAQANSPGVELALDWLAARGLRLGLTGSWNDAQIAQDVFAQSTGLDPVTSLPTGAVVPIRVFSDGDRLNNVPEWTMGATIDYMHPLPRGMNLSMRASAQHASQQEVRSFGVTRIGDSLTTVDARIGLESGRWGIHLFARNLLDEDGVAGPDWSIANYGNRYRPRTIGLNVKFQY